VIYYMSNITDLESFKFKNSVETKKLVALGGDLDSVIIKYLQKGCIPAEVAVIMAHRLSELLINLEKETSIKVMEVAFNIIEERVNNA